MVKNEKVFLRVFLMIRFCAKIQKKKAQTTTELAVFGAVLIFVIGMIVRQSMGFGYRQNHNLKAMRMAMSESFRFSQGMKGYGGPDGDTSRNVATVIIVEDRLSVDGSKYGGTDRTPQIAQGSGAHSRNFFQPVEAGEGYQMPAVDMFINGTYVALSTAKLRTVGLVAEPDGKRYVYERIPNHPEMEYNSAPDWVGNFHPFDLTRNGHVDVDPSLWSVFGWQWKRVEALKSNVEEGDVFDVDGDLKEERIVKVHLSGDHVISVVVSDTQNADIDMSYDTYDKSVGKLSSGLTNETMFFSYTKNPRVEGPGTYLRIEEGKLFDQNDQFIRSVQRRDTMDMISRRIRLANDNGIWCQGGSPFNYGGASPSVKAYYGYFNGMTVNPVEACGDCAGNNIDKNCFEQAEFSGQVQYYSLYIRSRIQDKRGRKWVTRVQDDPYLDMGR